MGCAFALLAPQPVAPWDAPKGFAMGGGIQGLRHRVHHGLRGCGMGFALGGRKLVVPQVAPLVAEAAVV
eukprot:8899319-Pyramimonas_sp.AAC.1